MELQTRQLTFNEMYFKKPITRYLPIAPTQNTINTDILVSGGEISTPAPLQGPPRIDLEDSVFPSPTFSEKAGKFIGKYWPWLLIGTVLITGSLIAYENHKKRKAKALNQYSSNGLSKQV